MILIEKPKHCECLFTEKLYDIESDSDYIYNKYIKNFVDRVINNNLNKFELDTVNNVNNYCRLAVCQSKELTSSDCMEAHRLKPIQIEIAIKEDNSRYIYNENRILIFISPTNIKKVLGVNVKNKVDKHLVVLFKNGGLFKYVLTHELSHWVRDALSNKYLSKYDMVALKKQITIIQYLKTDVSLSHIEIDAQVHTIKQIKSIVGEKRWNKMLLEQLVELYPSLKLIYEKLMMSNGRLVVNWERSLIKRMHREGLMGDKMGRSIDFGSVEV